MESGIVGYGLNPSSVAGLEPEDILLLPTSRLPKGDSDNDVCSICLDTYKVPSDPITDVNISIRKETLSG